MAWDNNGGGGYNGGNRNNYGNRNGNGSNWNGGGYRNNYGDRGGSNNYNRGGSYNGNSRRNGEGGYGGNSYGGGNGGGGNYQNNEPIEVRLYKAYVGTGNKEAPANVLEAMKRIANELSTFGYTLRTGGLDGPDQAFEDGDQKCELYLPWRGFNNRESKLTFNTPESLGTAKMFHTGFDTLKPAIQAFLAKNARMVLGKDMRSPARFVLCWSEDGAETSKEKNARTGNVGHVIAIANALKIPVFNLGKPDAESRLKLYLELTNDETQSKPELQQSSDKQHDRDSDNRGGNGNFDDGDFSY